MLLIAILLICGYKDTKNVSATQTFCRFSFFFVQNLVEIQLIKWFKKKIIRNRDTETQRLSFITLCAVIKTLCV